MNAWAAAVLLLAAVAAVSAADDPTGKLDGVVDLTPANFATEHDGRRAALIEFYAPWCGHCKRLVPEYAKLGAKIAADPKLKNRVLIAKVDADAHRSLGEKFGIRGFPTIKWFPRGKAGEPVDYNGGRSMADFLKFIEEKVAADAGFARVDALVPLAQKFQAATSEADKKAALAEAEKAAAAASGDDKDNAALYLKYMKKALATGAEYIATELARLTKMAEKAMSATKANEVARKVSVLSSFVEAPEAAPAAAAKEEAPKKAAAAGGDKHEEGEEFELDDDEDAPSGAKAAADDDDDEVYADGLDDNEGADSPMGTDDQPPAAGAAEEDDDPYDDSEL